MSETTARRIVTDDEAESLREQAAADFDRIPDYYFHRINRLLDTREELTAEIERLRADLRAADELNGVLNAERTRLSADLEQAYDRLNEARGT